MIVFPKKIQRDDIYEKFVDLRARAECSHGWQGRPIYLQHFGHSVEFSQLEAREKPYFCHTICTIFLPEKIDTWEHEADWNRIMECITEFNNMFADGFIYRPKIAEIEDCIRNAITNVRSYYPAGYNAHILIAFHNFKVKAFLANCSDMAEVYSLLTFCMKNLEETPIDKIIESALKSVDAFS